MIQYGAFVLTKFEELLEVLPEAAVPAEALVF
jgi:hypothetical protein